MGSRFPGIAVMKEDGDCELIRTFGYGDFKGDWHNGDGGKDRYDR